MKSIAIASLFLSSVVFALPAGVKRDDHLATDLAGAPPAPAAGSDPSSTIEVDSSIVTESNSPDTESTESEEPNPDNLGLDTTASGSADVPEITTVAGAEPLPSEDTTLPDDGPEIDTGAQPTDVAEPEPTEDSSLESDTEATLPAPPSNPGGSTGSCSPGKYQCSANNAGWEVCDALGSWVKGGDCQSGTTCQFNAANGSPYCVSGAAGSAPPTSGSDADTVVEPSPETITEPESDTDSGLNAGAEPVGDETPITTSLPADTSDPAETSAIPPTETDATESSDTDESGGETPSSGSEPPVSGSEPVSPDSELSSSGDEPTKSVDSASTLPAPSSGSEMETNGKGEGPDTVAEPTDVQVEVPAETLGPDATETTPE